LRVFVSMHGFINESVSKITDGIGGALLLLFTLGFTSLVLFPLASSLQWVGSALYILVLLAGGVLFLYRSLAPGVSDAQRASSGMLAGILLWQLLRFTGFPDRIGLIDPGGGLIWVAAALVMGFLWVKVFPLGLRFAFLLLFLNWLGKIYVTSLNINNDLPRLLEQGFSTIRYMGMAGIAVSLWFIIFRSRSILQRKYGAAALYFFVLLSFLLF